MISIVTRALVIAWIVAGTPAIGLAQDGRVHPPRDSAPRCDSDFDGALIGAAIGSVPAWVAIMGDRESEKNIGPFVFGVLGGIAGFWAGLAIDSRNCREPEPRTLRERPRGSTIPEAVVLAALEGFLSRLDPEENGPLLLFDRNVPQSSALTSRLERLGVERTGRCLEVPVLVLTDYKELESGRAAVRLAFTIPDRPHHAHYYEIVCDDGRCRATPDPAFDRGDAVAACDR